MSRWIGSVGIAAIGAGLILLAVWAYGELENDAPPQAPAADASVTAQPPAVTNPSAAEPQGVEVLEIEEISRRDHDPTAWTQGLVIEDGIIYESTGASFGPTSLRANELEGDAEVNSLVRSDGLYGEGLERVGDELIQLTWQDGVALVFDAASFEQTGSFRYEGEGWGLCLLVDGDGERLVMSNGSPILTFRDPETFEPIGSVEVVRDGMPVALLNELECVDGEVWANRWTTNELVRIDPVSGAITGVADMGVFGLTNEDTSAYPNGIAWDEQTETFWVTGKLWPTMFEVRFG